MGKKVLVVDDEKEIADLVEVYLKNDGYEVLKFYNATDALHCVMEEQEPDLALLDVMLPDMSGFTLCQKIREKYLFPIIMLTAKVEDMDKITGLTLGADDYITKPFNPLEIDIRGLQICKNKHKCTLNGVELNLTPIEFDILWYLCEHQGKVVSSEELFEAIWKEKYLDNNNTVMTHIARLREKMQEPARKPKYVKTVWGVGYTIE